MAVSKVVALSKLTSGSQKFTIKVRLGPVLETATFVHKTTNEEMQYISTTGADGDGKRVSLAFFGLSREQVASSGAAGKTVLLGGAQVRIKNPQYSLSTIPFDLVCDKFVKLRVADEGDQVSAYPPVTTVSELVPGRPGDVAVVYLSGGTATTVEGKVSGKPHIKSEILVCDSSTGKRYEVQGWDTAAHHLDSISGDSSGGDVLLCHGVCKEHVANGFRLVLNKNGEVRRNPGGEEEPCCV